MRRATKLLLALAVSALLAAGLVACGDDSSSDSTAAATTSAAPQTTPHPSADETGADGTGADEGKKGGGGEGAGADESGGESGAAAKGSKSFVVPGGDNSVQNYGSEADAAEMKEVEKTISGFLDARAEGDWGQACTYLAKTTLKPIEQLAARAPQLQGKDCGQLLETLSGATPPAARVNTMTNGLGSFRAEGERGFALYHGDRGVDYFVPMINEDGTWKVGSLAPTEV